MNFCEKAILTFLLVSGIFGSTASAAIPPAPTLLSPASGATVQQPFVESWSAVTDPTGIVAYNWQMSTSAAFTTIIRQGSTNGATQATISGLSNGTYFIQVQAVNGDITQGAWSAANSLVVSGSGPGAPASPVLQPTKAYSTFHPYELIVFNWSAVPGAVTYTLQFSLDSSFSVIKTSQFDNQPNPTMSFEIGNPEGNYFARAFAVNAAGILSAPSNVITFSVFFTNPIGPAPVIISPISGGTLTLPITLKWADVPNPQPSGYELQVAKDSGFKTIEDDEPQLNDPTRALVTLTPGAKFWRVRSTQGDSTPLLPAETAWSATGTFTVSSAPPGPVSITLATPQLWSGDSTAVQIQLTAAVPATGAVMSLTSSNPVAFPVPATMQFPGGAAWTQFFVQTGQVTVPSPVTFTATVNGQSSSIQFTVNPPSLKSIDISKSVIGGAQPQTFIRLNGQAPPGGAIISVSSDSPVITVPATVTAAPGFYWAALPVSSTPVTVNTPVTLTATWQGSTAQSVVNVLPTQPATSISLSPTSVSGGAANSFATVTISSFAPSDDTLQVTVSNPAVASAPATVTIPLGSTAGTFTITTRPVTTPTPVTITVSGGGSTLSAVLTVTPAAQVAISTLALSPTSLTGGGTSTGTVTLASAAPFGGAVVNLSSSNPAAASVPGTVGISAGATIGFFTISTPAVSVSTAATISATSGGVTRTAVLNVNAPAQTATLTVAASGRSGTNITSSPAGINVATGSTGQAPFTVGTTITLSATGGRDVIWSGACTGNKTKSCSFKLTGNASVSAAVQ
jgi:hypothetical protein